MARFFPDTSLEDIPYQSERLVYKALQQLDDQYTVLHSLPWLRPERNHWGAPLREGEADFVLLHPRHGLLVLEVKGGEPVLEGREWRRGSKRMKDPFEQARKSMHVLIESLSAGGVPQRALAHGYAVFFPNSTYQGDLPPHADKAIVLDARDLGRIDQRIAQAMRAWGEKKIPLSSDQLRLARAALMPSLRLVRCVGPALEQDKAQVIRLTRAQHETLTGLFSSPRVLVEGVAGSGKTLLALEAAILRASEGMRVRFLCYNRHLAAWLRERVSLELRLRSAPGSVAVDHFHSLAIRLARDARVEIPDSLTQNFWEQEAASVLDQAIDLLKGSRRDPTCDALVIDEAQDFREGWWEALLELLDDFDSGPLYAFMDLDQSLWSQASPPPPELFPLRFPLLTNCRNTKRISISSGRFASSDVRALAGMPQGVRVEHRRANTDDEVAKLVESTLRRLLREDSLRPRQIALIGVSAHGRGPLAGVSELCGARLTTEAAEWREGGALLSTTARAFKGLEADVIILYGLGSLGAHFTTKDLYVAWTRARHLLVVVSEKGRARREVEAALQHGELS